MLDLLAAIVSADPPSLLAWLVLAFAAGMYPIGIMLGSTCSPCCSTVPLCQACDGGNMPETVTLTMNNWTNTQTPGPPLANLVFTSDFGDGAAGRVTAPGGGNPGPISAVLLTSGGAGYARLVSNRIAPTVTASVTGTQAFSVTLQKEGEGQEAVWRVASIALDGEGTASGDQVTFTVQPGIEVSPAVAHLVRNRLPPSISVTVQSASGGGADLVLPTTQADSHCDGSTVWRGGPPAINGGGGGYAVGDPVVITLNNGTVSDCGFGDSWVVKSVNSNGAILDLELATDDPFVIQNYFVEYYRPGGAIVAVVLDDGGEYYATTPPVLEVANVTVGVVQLGIDGELGAVITPTIDTSPNSPSFGEIVSLSITNGGAGYLAWKMVESCCATMNTIRIALRRPRFGIPCLYYADFGVTGPQAACFGSVSINYSPASVRLDITGPGGCSATAFATPRAEAGETCVSLPFTAVAANGATFSVEAGGDFVPLAQGVSECCPEGGMGPEEIQATVFPPSGSGDPYDLVLQRNAARGAASFAFPVRCSAVYGLLYGSLGGVYVAVAVCDDYFSAGCQSCPRGCQTVAGIFSGDYRTGSTHWTTIPCEYCRAPSMCEPVERTYVVRRNLLNGNDESSPDEDYHRIRLGDD